MPTQNSLALRSLKFLQIVISLSIIMFCFGAFGATTTPSGLKNHMIMMPATIWAQGAGSTAAKSGGAPGGEKQVIATQHGIQCGVRQFVSPQEQN